MHIEPGVVDGAKILLSYATAAGAFGLTATFAYRTARREGLQALAARAVVTTALVFAFFEVLPHYPVGVSEVHLILGSTLFLLFGAGPAAIGLAMGLFLQGVFFAPFDLPQYGMNVTTLIFPLLLVSHISNRLIAPQTPYVDLRYGQALALSTAYQAGIVAWVAFWAVYGHGFAYENLQAITSFGAAYLLVVVAEPLIDLGVLALAKLQRKLGETPLIQRRVFLSVGTA